MAWPASFPATNGTDLGSWENVIAPVFRDALVERGWLAGACQFPQESRHFYDGTITAATETLLTDSGASFCIPDMTGPFADPWGCHRDDPDSQLPSSWYLVIDDNDASKVIITGASPASATTITIGNIRDYFTNGQLGTGTGTAAATVTSLVGKSYYIIRGDRGLAWSQRVIEWPNCREYAKGTVTTYTATTTGEILPASPSATKLRDDTAHWKDNEHAGRHLLVYAADGFLKRIPVISNTHNVLTFASQASLPSAGSSYVVVVAGGRAIPGRNPCQPYAWYRGARETYLSHSPEDDSIITASMPASTVAVPHFHDGACDGGFQVEAWDTDVISDDPVSGDDVGCTIPGKFYSPDLWKTPRGVQLALEGLSQFYVEPGLTYDGASKIPFLNPAEMFRVAGVNSYTGTTGGVEDTTVGSVIGAGGQNNAIAFSGITLPYYPIQVWYSIHRDMGQGQWHWHRGVVTQAGRLLHENSDLEFLQSDSGATPPIVGDDGQTIVMSPGWTRYVEKQFVRMWDEPGVFIPDTVADPITGDLNAIDPPEVVDFGGSGCLGMGTWAARGKSTKYIERKGETQGYSTAQGFAVEQGDDIANGDVARWVGTNFWDTTVSSGVGSGFFKDETDPTARYFDRFYVGKLEQHHQAARDGQLGGTATDGGNFWLEDTDKDWFNFQTFAGTARTETGTATGGSTTSLTDTSKASGTEGNCAWTLARFGGANPYLGFVVEIDQDDGSGTGGVNTFRRLVTASDADAVSLTWAEPLPASANGCVYRIVEPYKMGRYVGRTIRIGLANGTTVTSTITGNDATTLFFTALPDGANVSLGCSYTIEDGTPGGVWKKGTGGWTPPTGDDSTPRTTLTAAVTQQPWHKNQFENLPHHQKRYGRYMVQDRVFAETINELYAVYNALIWARVPGTWTSRADPGTPENNHDRETGLGNQAFLSNDEYDAVAAMWGTHVDEAGAPHAKAAGTSEYGNGTGPSDFTVEAVNWELDRSYGYLNATICGRQTTGRDFYAFSLAPGPALESDVTSGTFHNVVKFDANGDAVKYNAWSKFGSSSGLGTSAQLSLGSISGPSAGALPSRVYNPSIDCSVSTIQGYEVTDQCVIVRGDVSGGLVYRS